jgi:hypothetical protein
MRNAKLVIPLLSFWIFSGCADQDRASLRDCAEATTLEARLMREYSELLMSTDPATGPIHIDAYKKALSAVNNWKRSACPKEEEPTEKR